jgi:hypothetical protein
MTESSFPLGSFREAAQDLRRPFTPEAVKWKPKQVLGDGKGVMCVAYIDARLVIERLNLILPERWHDEYRSVGNGQMWCDLTVDGITRSDVGEGQGKALVSDAFKRAAVKFGVGVSLYATPQIWINEGAKLVTVWQSGQKPNGKTKYDARLEDAGDAMLRDRYAQWLDRAGRAAFGVPLDHGDAPAAQGDHEAAGRDDAPHDAPQASPPAREPYRLPDDVFRRIIDEVRWAGQAAIPAVEVWLDQHGAPPADRASQRIRQLPVPIAEELLAFLRYEPAVK